jgi:hypothetical protein
MTTTVQVKVAAVFTEEVAEIRYSHGWRTSPAGSRGRPWWPTT